MALDLSKFENCRTQTSICIVE